MKTSKNLLIVFVKNIQLGKVKTRLAKTIGDELAYEVYKHLVDITERETNKVRNCDVHIYFSDFITNEQWEKNKNKFVQQGNNLGDRMLNAFKNGFNLGYQNVIGIGSDLPDLSASIITEGFESLKTYQTVFGPAQDGGYYLIGMNTFLPFVFQNKPWSQKKLLNITIAELEEKKHTTKRLRTLNDIDTIEDLRASHINEHFQL